MATPGIRLRPGAGSIAGPQLPPTSERIVDQSAEDFLRDIRAARGGGPPEAAGIPWYRAILEGLTSELGLGRLGATGAGVEGFAGAGEEKPSAPTAPAIPRPPTAAPRPRPQEPTYLSGVAERIRRSQEHAEKVWGTPTSRLQSRVTSGLLSIPQAAAGLGQVVTGGRIGGETYRGLGEVRQAFTGKQEGTFPEKLAEGLGSLLAFGQIGVGLRAGLSGLAKTAPRLYRWIAPGSAAFAEAATEAGSLGGDILQEGRSVGDARKAAALNFSLNLPIIGITNKLGIFDDKVRSRFLKAGISFLMEGTQESAQEWAQQWPAGRPIDWGAIREAGLIGGILGGGIGLMGGFGARRGDETAGAPVQPAVPPPPAEARQPIGALGPAPIPLRSSDAMFERAAQLARSVGSIDQMQAIMESEGLAGQPGLREAIGAAVLRPDIAETSTAQGAAGGLQLALPPSPIEGEIARQRQAMAQGTGRAITLPPSTRRGIPGGQGILVDLIESRIDRGLDAGQIRKDLASYGITNQRFPGLDAAVLATLKAKTGLPPGAGVPAAEPGVRYQAPEEGSREYFLRQLGLSSPTAMEAPPAVQAEVRPSAPAVTPPQPTPVTEAPRGMAQGPGVTPAVSPAPAAPPVDIQQHPLYAELVQRLTGDPKDRTSVGMKKSDARARAAAILAQHPDADIDSLTLLAVGVNPKALGLPEIVQPPAPPSKTAAPEVAPPPFPAGEAAETTPVTTTGPALPPQTAQATPGTEVPPSVPPGTPPGAAPSQVGQTFEITDGPDRGIVGKIIEVLPHPTRGMEVPTFRIQVKKKVFSVPSNMGRIITQAPVAPKPPAALVPTGPIAGDNVPPPDGPQGIAFGPDAKPIPFVWRWLDPTTDVITSHDTNLTARPGEVYPVDVQNRNRLTAESRVSYDRIRKNPIGERYATGTELDTGAPWVVPWQSKLVVPVGNIRTLAYISAQSVAPEQWSTANQFLQKEALRIGIPQAEIDAKPKGGLFRQPVNPVMDLVQFAISGNTGSTPALSPSEQARTDAYLVPPDIFTTFQEGTETGIENALRAPRNRAFVTDILSRVVQSGQLSTMVDPDGSFNRVAIRRVAGMMLDKAYAPSADVLAMALEATHPDLGRVITAYQNVAGRVLKADARVANGEVPSIAREALGKDLGAGLSALAAIRQSGQKVEAYLNPPPTLPGMERGMTLTPHQADLLRQLDQIGTRSESEVRNWIKSLVDPILVAPDERQVAMFLSAEGRERLYREAGFDPEMERQLRDTFALARAASDTAFILRDGTRLSFQFRQAGTGILGPPVDRVVTHDRAVTMLPKPTTLPELFQRTGAIRVNGGDAVEIHRPPSPLQVAGIVENARRVARERGDSPVLFVDVIHPDSPYEAARGFMIENPTVEHPQLQQALAYARDVHIAAGWLDDGRGMGTTVAQFAIVRDLDGTVRAVPEFNVQRTMDVMGENLYKGQIPSVIAKELLANSIDSFGPERLTPTAPVGPPAQLSILDQMRGRRQAGALAAPRRPTVSLVTDDKANTITVRDNGEGMLPEVAGTAFVDPFSSQKLSAQSVGRFGIAKIAIIRNSETFELVTRARDVSGKIIKTRLTGSGDDYAAGRGLKMETREVPGGETGTTVKVKLKPEFEVSRWSMGDKLRELLSHSRLPVQVNVRLAGETLRSQRTEMAEIGTERSPGARLGFSVSHEFKPISINNAAYPIRVLNNGMYQFDFTVFAMPGAVLPTETSVDIAATVEPEHGNYPFDLNRQGLRAGADEVVRNFFRDQLLPRATEMTNERYIRAWNNAPTILGTDFKMVDVTQKVPAAKLQILVKTPHLFRYVQAANQAFDAIQPVLVEAWPEIGQAQFGGVGIGGGFRAMVLRMSDVDKTLGYQVLVNPYAILSAINQRAAEREVTLTEQQREAMFAQDTAASILHELTHTRSGAWSEGPDFSAALTESAAQATFVMPRAAQAIYSAVGGTNASTVEFVNDLTTILRPVWTKDNVFGPLASQLGGEPRLALPPGAPGGGPAAGVGPRSPVFRGRGVRPEEFATGPSLRPGASRRASPPADVLTILEPATIETRLAPPGPVGTAGEIVDGKLVGTHVAGDPEIALAALRAGASLPMVKQGGRLGGGLYFSGVPQLWQGRGLQSLYENLGRLDPDARRRVVTSIRAESQHTFQPGYLTESERDQVKRYLEGYQKTGDAALLGLAASQPFNMDVTGGAQAAGITYRPPTNIPIEVQGKLLDYGSLTRDQLTSLNAAAEEWLRENGYVDANGNPTIRDPENKPGLGLRVIRRFGAHQDLFNEYLRALGYDGAFERGHMIQEPETVVWNSDAIRRFGDWRNPRPAPGVIGEGTFYPPRPGYVRLFRGEVETPLGPEAALPDWAQDPGSSEAAGRWFTSDPNRARLYAAKGGIKGRVVFADVPAAVADASKLPGGSALVGSEWIIPKEFADQKRVLWSRTADYARLQGHGEIPNPYDTSKLANRDALTNRRRLEALWSRFDSGEIGLRDQVRQMQELRRGIAETIIRTNPEIFGSVLTDGRDYISIHPGANPSEPARLTTFSKDGPTGHTVYQTPQEALVEAIREGYVDPVPPRELDRLALTPAFQQGIDVASVVRFGNHLNYINHPARSLYSRLPWEMQIKIATDPAEQERFLAGTVPDSIAMFAKDSSELLQPPSQRPKRPAPVQQTLFPSEAIPRSMPGEKLKPTVAQVPTERLLDELRPPLPPGPDLFAERPTPEQTETEGVELGAFFGVPRLTKEQRQALLKAFRQVFGREGEAEVSKGRTAKRKFGTLRRLQAGIAKRGAYSLEGYLHSLGSQAALDMEMALKNTWADYNRMAEKMWSMISPSESEARPYLQNLYEVLRGEAEPQNEIVRRAYERFLILIHPDTGFIPVNTRERDIRGYTGPGGREGPRRPFTPRTVDLMTRVYPDGYIDAVLRHGSTAREEAAQHMFNTGQATDIADAMAKIDANFRRDSDPFAPSLTEARRPDLPGHIKDPFAAWAVRIDQDARRFAFHDNLGPKHVYVKGDADSGRIGWLTKIEEAHGYLASQAARSLYDYAFAPYGDTDLVAKIIGGIQNYETATKLPLAFIQNLGQNSQAGVMVGIRPWMQAVVERSGLLGPSGKARAREAARVTGVTFRQALRDLETQAGISANAPLAGIARKTLWIWRWSETDMNRTIAPRTAEIALQKVDAQLRSGMQLNKATTNLLKKIGIDPDQAQQRGSLTREEITRGMWGVLDDTQFIERPSAVPPLFDPRGPLGVLGPMIFQWKSYMLRYNRFLWQNMVQEMGQGNLKPMLRFMIMAPAIGEIVGSLRAAIGRRDRKWIWEEEGAWDLGTHALKNLGEAYGMGILGGLVEALGYGGLAVADWAAGPGLSQLRRTLMGTYEGFRRTVEAQDGTTSTQDALNRWFRDVKRAVVGEVPIFGRPFKARDWTEAEQIERMKRDRNQAMHKAAELRAQAIRRTGRESTAFERRSEQTLEDFNRKYRDVPGFNPLQNVEYDTIIEAIKRIDQTELERARRRAPRDIRGARPDPWQRFKKELGLGGDLSSMLPPETQHKVLAAAALVAGGPSAHFKRTMDRLEAGGEIPRPPVMALASVIEAEAESARERHVALLPPDRQREIRAMLAMARGQA